jgi:hypothetical protein
MGRATFIYVLAAGAMASLLAAGSAAATASAGTTASARTTATAAGRLASPRPARPRGSRRVPVYCGQGGSLLWANPALCGWPWSSNTGPVLSRCPLGRLAPLGASKYQTIYIRQAGTIISCRQIQGMVDIQASNVQILNSTVLANSGKTGEANNGTADIKVEDGASATIDHVTANGDNGVMACVFHQGTQLSVTALNCSSVRDGVFSWADTGYSATTGDNFTITGSYFHDFTVLSNSHEDGYQTEGAAHGRIQGNTFQLSLGANSAIGIWDGLRSSTDITVSGNLLTGGQFTVYAQDYSPGDGAPGHPSAAGGNSLTNVQFLNNSFSTYAAGCVGRYGVWFTRPTWVPYQAGATDGWHRSGNRVLETGENIDNGNPHYRGALCG